MIQHSIDGGRVGWSGVGPTTQCEVTATTTGMDIGIGIGRGISAGAGVGQEGLE